MPQNQPSWEQHYAHQTAENDAAWGPILPERRRRWCQAQLDYPPSHRTPMLMIYTACTVRHGGYTTFPKWVAVAREFEAIGLTPDTYSLLRLCIEKVLGEGAEHALLHRDADHNTAPPSLNTADWVEWPQFLEAGLPPLRATERILNPNSAPQGQYMNAQGTVVITTDV